jgi:hypothetical protein
MLYVAILPVRLNQNSTVKIGPKATAVSQEHMFDPLPFVTERLLPPNLLCAVEMSAPARVIALFSSLESLVVVAPFVPSNGKRSFVCGK